MPLPSFPQPPQIPPAPQPPEPPPPPAAAQCITTTQLAAPGALPQQTASNMLRSADGKMRVDFGNSSVITDPTAQKSILLDHVKKEATTIPMPQGPQLTPPPLPAGAMPSAGIPPQVVELGKAFIEGHEVDGKQFTFQPPQLPQPPALPQMPPKPQLPGMPAPPPIPQMPPAPPMPTVAEVWTSTKTKLPVLTKITGPSGQSICHCKVAETPPPPPTAFEVPPDYKHVSLPAPPKPELPAVPQPPQMPALPKPAVPAMPKPPGFPH